MSVRMMALVWELVLPDSEKLVLLALADSANDEGHCWPSIETLAKKCSKGERTVQGCIKMLIVKGHLSRRERHATSCYYTVHPIVRFAADPAVAAPRSDCTPQPLPEPPQPLHPPPAAAAPKPSKNHNKPSYIKGTGLPEGFPVEPYMALVRARLSLRPKVHFTEDAARGIVRKCERLQGEGYDPAKLLWKAVDQGWRTVFANDDCKATTTAKPIDWEATAKLFEKIGREDDARELRRKYAAPIGQVANDILKQAGGMK